MKKLVLSDIHESIGGKMINFSGYKMPVQYSDGVIVEHQTVRESVGVFDVSHMGEIFITGVEALNLLQYVTTNDVSSLKPGKIQYTCFPNETGGIVDDFLLYMIAKDNYMLVVNASNLEKDIEWLNQKNSFGCIIKDQSANYSLLALQGPNSIALLQELAKINLSNMKYYSFQIGSIANIEDVIISRTGYTGEIGFELYVQNHNIERLWNALFSTSIKLKPIGLAARDTLRLEKGFCLYGNDIDENTSPIEAGLSWITKFTKKFINYKQLKLQKEKGTRKKLVGLQLIDKGIARNGYPIFNSDKIEIGKITSGTMSPTLKESIALAYILTESSEIGNRVMIKVRNKILSASIVSLPFVK